MLLFSQNQSALIEFPCTVYIERFRNDSEPVDRFRVICDNLIFAEYGSKIPAKLELVRLTDAYMAGEKLFEFCKEV